MYIEHEDSGWSDPRLTQSRVLYTAGLTSVYIVDGQPHANTEPCVVYCWTDQCI